ncbi:coiled-coil domain-containing protein 137 isoform X1 [Phaenicophaeus curvirostris]|uniref:coiled-coil domain-containing protein 137 isoform X1 n=1 Tax=Phaenicophaeus curvirostris TaxID=33595 RepID=UPI0037F0D407
MGRGPGQGPGRGQRQGQGKRQGQRQGPVRGQGQRSGQGKRPGQVQKPRTGQRPGQGPGQGPRSGQGQKPGKGQRPGQDPATPHRSRKQKKVDNMKPKHPDEQEIPFRLRELMKSREAMKRPDPGKRQAAEKKQQPKSKGPQATGDIPVPKFRRGKGESERSFICRMEQEVQRVMFLTKNQVQQEPEKEGMAPEKSKRKKEFQNKKLEKARKKKQEKKEAMLEKSLFQGWTEAASPDVSPGPEPSVPSSAGVDGSPAHRGGGESACHPGLQGHPEAQAAAARGSECPGWTQGSPLNPACRSWASPVPARTRWQHAGSTGPQDARGMIVPMLLFCF